MFAAAQIEAQDAGGSAGGDDGVGSPVSGDMDQMQRKLRLLQRAGWRLFASLVYIFKPLVYLLGF